MIRYAALGDSYTIGEGVREEERWPNLVVARLRSSGMDVQLVANPSVTGWATQDLIDKELPVYRKCEPDFATLLIGVNDWVQEVPLERFEENLEYILDEMLLKLEGTHRLVVVTIPDFGATPEGYRYGKGRDISAGILAFNNSIKSLSAKRSVAVADIFNLSKEMKDDPALTGSDGLHPSATAYEHWERLITPVVYGCLKQ